MRLYSRINPSHPLLWIILFLMGLLPACGQGPQTGTANRPQATMTNLVQTTPSPARNLADQLSSLFEAAAEKVSPSVVPIFSEQEVNVGNPYGFSDDPFRQFFGDDFFKRFFGTPPQGDQKQIVRGLGSGVIVSADGYILTNNHVVAGAEKLTVVMTDNKKYSAKIIGTDPQTDVALIKIEGSNFPVATLGNSDNVKIGEWVIAVGNPFQLLHTVTAGIISAKGRSSVGLADYEDFIQTDASINPGNSGGALADLDGNVIAINTAISSPSGGNVGIGFAIPINMAGRVMEDLKTKGKVTRGYLAITPQDIDDNLAKALKMKNTEGALVGGVIADGPADKAGVKRGDVILKFNGQKVKNSTDLRNMVAQADPGSKAKLTLFRDGKEVEVTVTLGERPRTNGKGTEQPSQPEENTSKKLGMSIQTLNGDLAAQLGYKNESGVVITDITAGGAADDAGLKAGDLIKEVNRVSISDVRDFNRVMKKVKSGDSAALLIRRGNNTFYAGVQVP
jgi:serine protease Do